MRLRLATVILLMPLPFGPALADRIEAVSRIDSVSVHPDGAKVVRRVEVDLPKGASTVAISGLPRFLDSDSVRVTGRSDEPIAIIGQVIAPMKPSTKAKEEAVKAAMASPGLVP